MTVHAIVTGKNKSKANPLMLKYVRMLRLFCYPFGIWPGNMLDDKMPSCYRYFIKQGPIQALVVFCGEVNYLIRRHSDIDFFTIGDVCITTCLTIVTFARILLPNFKNYGLIWRKFFKTFHLGNFMDKGDNFKKVSIKMDTVSHYFTLLMILFTLFGMILFNLSPIWNNITNGAYTKKRHENITLRFSVLYEYPGFRPEDHFIITTLLNFYFSYACTICICAIDLMLILMVFQIIGHIEVLCKNLHDFPLPKNKINFEIVTADKRRMEMSFEKFNPEENEFIHYQLKENVNHHRFIVDFVTEISSFFGPMMGINYLYQLVGCCLLLLECSQMDSQALARFGPLTVISMAQLIEISVIFEIVGSMFQLGNYVNITKQNPTARSNANQMMTFPIGNVINGFVNSLADHNSLGSELHNFIFIQQSEKLIDTVYHLPWQYMDMKNQRTVHIFFNRVQRIIHVTCMGVTPIGVQSMAAILKTSFSYFTFLRSMDAQ